MQEITDVVLLSSISGGSAEHDRDNNSSNSGTGTGNGGDALHSAWANLEGGILAAEGYNCGNDHFYSGGHSFTGFGGHINC